MRVCQVREALGGAFKKGKWDSSRFGVIEERLTTVLEDIRFMPDWNMYGTMHCRRAIYTSWRCTEAPRFVFRGCSLLARPLDSIVYGAVPACSTYGICTFVMGIHTLPEIGTLSPSGGDCRVFWSPFRRWQVISEASTYRLGIWCFLSFAFTFQFETHCDFTRRLVSCHRRHLLRHY